MFAVFFVKYRFLSYHLASFESVPKRVPKIDWVRFTQEAIMAIKGTLKLTDRDIRQWVKSNTRFDAKPDGNGLYIRYRAVDKTPLFYFRFKFAGVENKIILGKYPDKSLASARKDCIGHRAAILKGINPAILKREQKAESIAKALAEQNTNSVGELVDDFCKRNIDGCKSAIEIRQRIDNPYHPRYWQNEGGCRIADTHIKHAGRNRKTQRSQ